MPGGRERWRLGSVASTAIHIAILWLLLRGTNYGGLVTPIEQGAGGPGPAGGGGGRSSARMEVIQYAAVQPPPPPTPKPTFVFKPPEITQLPPPVIQPLRMEPIVSPGLNATGSAIDPTGGAGPGSGGGVGSGVGTGKGSSVGPGTGGGDQPNYPPQAIEIFIPPLPVPASVRGFHLIAEFDVDERGKVLSMKFSETSDRGYNRRLQDVLKSFRFRPGTKPDGTPVRMKAQISIDLP
jgi:protein TonB